jgi:hypothetical protein
MAQLAALWYSALCEVRLGNTGRVHELADEMQALVAEFALAHGQTACRWFRGWVDARTGAPRAGYELIVGAYDDNTRLGMLAGASEVLGYATEALILAGDHDEAHKRLTQALHVAGELGERVYLPQLYLLEGAIARARGDRTTADASTRRALAEARAQEAPWLELTALIELCEHHRPKPADRSALESLVDALPDASGTAAVAKARALIDAARKA